MNYDEENVKNTKNAKNAENIENAENTKNIESTENSENIENNENTKYEKTFDEFAKNNFVKDIKIPQNLMHEINDRISKVKTKRIGIGKRQWIAGFCAVAMVAIISSATLVGLNIINNKQGKDAPIDNQSNSIITQEPTTDNQSNSIIAKLNLQNAYLPQINESGGPIHSWALGYLNIQDLYHGADDIIIADVIGEGVIVEDSGIEIDVKVVSSLKNRYKEGDLVSIHQYGEITNDGKEWTIDGVPLLRKNMKVILFVHQYENNACVILNDYLGKFLIDTNGVISYSGDYTKPNNSLPNLLKGTTNISDFLYLMEKLKENEGKETPSP